MYIYGWFMLMYDRSQHNIAKQLSFDLKKEKCGLRRVQQAALPSSDFVLEEMATSARFKIRQLFSASDKLLRALDREKKMLRNKASCWKLMILTSTLH